MATERSVLVRLKADPSGFVTGFRTARGEVSGLQRDLDGADKSIDRFSGRLGLLLDAASALGPALVPIGAVGIPAVTGLASALGFAAIGAGTAVLAFQGIGDALDKVNKARLSPTTTNLAAAHEALQKLGPDARDLVAHLANLSDELKRLRDAAGSGILPGVDDALDSLMTRGPEVEKILHRVSNAVGDLIAEGGDSLASDKYDDFFNFIKTEAPPAIASLGHSVGDLAHGLTELWMAFDPLNDDVLGWLETAANDFDQWASKLDQTEGFQEFVDYIQTNGPQVGDTLGAIAMALLDIVEAAAPIGAATLPILEAVANVIGTIADSDLGTPLIGLLALSRAVSLFDRGLQSGPIASIRQLGPDIRTMSSTSVVAFGRATEETERYNKAAERTRATLGKLAKGGGALAGLAVVQSGLADKIGLTNTALGATAGLMVGGPWGAAIGGGIGLIKDFADSQDTAKVSAEALADAIDAQTGALSAQGYAAVGEAFAGLSDDADKAGISLADVIQAAVQGGAAYDEMAKRIQAVIDADTYLSQDGTGKYLGDTAVAASNLSYALSGQNGEMNKAIDLARGRQAGLDAATDAEGRHRGAVDGTKGALAGLTAVTDTNKDGVIDNTDAILDNIAAMEERTDAINAAFDAETNYQRSLQIGADREKAAADLRKQIADAEARGARDRADLQQRLAGAKTPAERQSIQEQIQDSLERQAEAVRNLKEQLAEYAPTLDKTTKAGQANRDVLSQMAAGFNDLSDKQQNAKGKYEQARKALIDQAKQFGASSERAKKYADDLLELPPKVETKILLQKQEAQRQLDAFSAAFHGLDGDVAKAIVKLHIDQITGPGGKLDRTGGSYRTGGHTGNGPVDQPAGIVHGREFVVPAPYADRDRAALERAYLPGYQGGGYVEPARVVTAPSQISGPGIDLDRLAGLINSSAPYIGQATFNSRGDYDRAERRARRMRGAGGRVPA